MSCGGKQQHGALSKEELRHGAFSERKLCHGALSENGEMRDGESGKGAVSDDDIGLRTNMYVVNYVVWFDVSIEGRNEMDPDEDDWGGKVEFGFKKKDFSVEIDDYFVKFEDECLTQTHNCFGRVRGVLFAMKNLALQPPSYDTRNIIELVEKYGDGHILDSGWREVDPEEWTTN